MENPFILELFNTMSQALSAVWRDGYRMSVLQNSTDGRMINHYSFLGQHPHELCSSEQWQQQTPAAWLKTVGP